MRYRVLLALEEPSTRDFYSDSLSSAGFDVLTCAPAGATRSALAFRADAVVIDGSRAAGLSACRDFKSHPVLKTLPIVALAAPDGSSHFDALCDAVLPVECLPGALVDAVDRLLVEQHGRE